MTDLSSLIIEEERAKAQVVQAEVGSDDRFGHDEIIQRWDNASLDRGLLATGYAEQRGLELDLISTDILRTGFHQSSKKAKEHPALLFAATNNDGEVTRVQAIRFQSKPLNDGRVERFSGDFHPKITNGKGVDPVRFLAANDCSDDRLLICEGPEDAATLRQITGCETWASLSLSVLGRMPIPADRTVVVFADRGSEADTRKACEKLAEKGANVFFADPPADAKDVNEALCNDNVEGVIDALKSATIVASAYESLPEGYALHQSGWITNTAPSDPDDSGFVCKGLKVLGLARDAQSRDWGQLVEIEGPDGKTNRWVLPASALVGKGVDAHKTLASLGMQLSNRKEEQLRSLLLSWRPNIKYRTIDKLGWTDEKLDCFALPDGTLIAGVSHEPITLSGTIPVTIDKAKAGSLADWKASVGEVCVDNDLLMFAVAVAFLGPVLEPMFASGGGFHLVGESSRGKTTALRASASVWGPPLLVGTWRSTSNGLEGRAARHNSMMLYLDEMSEVEPKDASATAYMLANGEGKTRARRDASQQPVTHWCLGFLSSGELALADKLAEGRIVARAGQLVRLLDIPATTQKHGLFGNLHDAKTAANFADRVNRAASQNYGHAGPEFVRLLITHRSTALTEMRKVSEAFKAKVLKDYPKADGQVQRANDRFSLVLAAGHMAIEWGLLPWSNADLTKAVNEVLKLWLEKRGTAGAAERNEAITRVRKFVTVNGSGRFEKSEWHDQGVIGSGWKLVPVQRIQNRAGWYQPPRSGAPGIYWIAKDVWNTEIMAGLDPHKAATDLIDAGFMNASPNRKDKRVPKGITGGEQVYAFAVSSEILSFEEGEC